MPLDDDVEDELCAYLFQLAFETTPGSTIVDLACVLTGGSRRSPTYKAGEYIFSNIRSHLGLDPESFVLDELTSRMADVVVQGKQLFEAVFAPLPTVTVECQDRID